MTVDDFDITRKWNNSTFLQMTMIIKSDINVYELEMRPNAPVTKAQGQSIHDKQEIQNLCQFVIHNSFLLFKATIITLKIRQNAKSKVLRVLADRLLIF